ncbi:MAG: CHC2 zinc finger domain-containing protein [Gammaproteobacteria bacterium]|nr:CHC2 zinc finger domain-containing protein [Gammaproteobacteria bacterium]MDH5803371.1 CHC2 zinc finger domain-containing protein [Gammaproteobacteria bacterium]
MARISDDDLTRIKQDISLLRLVQAKGFKPKVHGKDYVMCCPFHADDTASLIISPDKNLWHCMGACQTGGSVIDWVMKTEGVSFRHAVELLRNDLPHLVAHTQAEEPKVVKCNSTPKLSPLTANPSNQAALRHVIDYYHDTLKQSPEALDYLEQRGLKHNELIDRFKLGYANRTLAYRLPQRNRQAGAEIRGQLQDIGLLRDTGHEHFNGCLVIPVMDDNGVITEVYGRKLLGNRLRKGTAQHLYLPGPHQGVWNIEAVKASREIILCESLIDAMTFWCAGFRNVTTSYGTSGFTDEHLNLFIQSGVEKVLIAYDRDEAGNKAADKLSKTLNEHGMDTYRVLFPKGMDANEYARQVQPAPKSLSLAIRKAEWMGKGQGRSSVASAESITSQNLADTVQKNKREEEATKSRNEPEEFILLAAEDVAHDMVTTDVPADISEHEVVMTLDNRHYRIRGLTKNLSYEQLKINLLIKEGGAYHVDTFDIYSAKHRAGYIKQAAQELAISEDIIKCDLGKVLLKLEELQDQQIKGTLAKKEKQPAMSDTQVKEALALLKEPALLDRILQDFNRCGVVGEETNKLVGYLAACSRKLDNPLAVMVQSSSAAGKSSLMEAVLSFIPEEERIQYSAMTGQALFYMGEQDLKHKILAIAEEEGAQNTAYALKLLQSEGEVSIASTGKNSVTGNLETQEYRVEGPVMLFSTTTAIDIDEELMNRCLVLSVDESREQTQAIHAQQRKRRTLEGLKAAKEKKKLIQLHQNAQRLLRPLAVMNPYADQLTFLDDKTRTRRDHEKYLGLIDTVALLHQYQRDVKRETWEGEVLEYIEVTLNDIATANQLAHEVLGRTLDELPPQTRRLLQLIKDMVLTQCEQQQLRQCDVRFNRRQVRDATGWSDGQLKIHCKRLEDMEYLLVHHGGRGRTMEYELLYDGDTQSDKAHVMGLIDIKKLTYDAQKLGSAKQKSVPSQGQARARSVPSQDDKQRVNTTDIESNGFNPELLRKHTSSKNNTASHHNNATPAFTAPAHPEPAVLEHPCSSAAQAVEAIS